jgi:hypothetical protein
MNRLFGRGKPKEPPPNLTDCIGNVCIEFFLLQRIYYFSGEEINENSIREV